MWCGPNEVVVVGGGGVGGSEGEGVTVAFVVRVGRLDEDLKDSE